MFHVQHPRRAPVSSLLACSPRPVHCRGTRCRAAFRPLGPRATAEARTTNARAPPGRHPPTMKPLRIKYNQRPFTVARDDAGVPHIVAASWLEALYGLGYLHAMDRSTQMLFARVMASGRSAELIANRPELLETDRLFRRVGLYLRLAEEVEGLPADARAECEAYSQVVNDWLKQSGWSFPMWATGFQPEPWDAKSILLLGNLLNFGGLAIGQQHQERLILELIQAGVDDERLRELFAPL